MNPIFPPRTEELLRQFAERRSVTVEEILHGASGEGAPRARRRRTVEDLIAGQLQISDRCAALPILDPRSPEELIGYNEQGVFD